MNGPASQEMFEGDEIFGAPYGICSYVYNDPAYTDGIDAEFLTVSDQGWDRLILHGLKGTIGEDDNQFIEARGQNGTSGPWKFNSPRYIAGDDFNLYVSDAYNNRVHVYEINIEVPQDTLNQFKGFDSTASPGPYSTQTPLRTPLGIDYVTFLLQPGNFRTKMIAVADHNNNRVAVFPNGYYGNNPGRSYGEPGYDSRYEFNRPTAVAYVWDKTTGWQKNELFVVSQGNGEIVWLQFENSDSLKPPIYVVKLDFDSLVFEGQAVANYYLSSAAVDNHGLLWVLDSYNSMVYKFYLNQNVSPYRLELIGSWGSYGTGDGQLNRPNALAAQHGAWVDRCGGNPGCPNNKYPLANLHDILITETWGPETGIRRFSIGVEAFVDSIKYIAKSDSGGGNIVNWWHHFTDYVNVTEKVYRMPQNMLVDTVTNNLEMPPRSDFFGFWNVGTNDSGTFRIEITATSLYGDVIDVKDTTVVVDTSRRNSRPIITPPGPKFVHASVSGCDTCWKCFFPSVPNSATPQDVGGDWMVATATDPDNDQLEYCWTPDSGYVGGLPGQTGSGTFCDIRFSAYYQVPDYYAPRGVAESTSGPLKSVRLRVKDPAGNYATPDGLLGIPDPCRKGDLNASGAYSPSDATLGLEVVFFDLPPPPSGDYKAMSDFNCDGQVTPADAVIFLAVIFLGTNPPC